MKCRRIIYILREKRVGGRTCGGIKYVVFMVMLHTYVTGFEKTRASTHNYKYLEILNLII